MPSSNVLNLLRILIRGIIPLSVLAGGVFAYLHLAKGINEDPEPVEEEKQIQTRVAEINATDYQVQITTQGIVQPINLITLSAQVSGQIVEISPQFEVGAYFSKGDILLRVDDRDYRTAVAAAKAAHLSETSARDLAQLNHDRTKKLFTKNGVSEAEVNQSAATLAQAEAAVDSAASAVEQAERDLERTSIPAPFSGRVREKSVGLGHSVGIGTPLGVVFGVDCAEVRLPIAGREMQYLTLPEHAGDEPVDVELRNAIQQTSETVWHAKIVRTEGTLDQDSLELFAIARIEDPFGLETDEPPLRIGQPVRATIKGATLTDVVRLPRNAVRQLDKINLINKDDLTLLPRSIEAVWSDEDHIIVRRRDIQPDTMLAMTPIVYPVEGSTVEVIPDAESHMSLEETAAIPATGQSKAN